MGTTVLSPPMAQPLGHILQPRLGVLNKHGVCGQIHHRLVIPLGNPILLQSVAVDMPPQQPGIGIIRLRDHQLVDNLSSGPIVPLDIGRVGPLIFLVVVCARCHLPSPEMRV